MDGEVLPKAIPSQELKSSWLQPSAVQRVINSLRANAEATSNTRDVSVKPNRNRRERNNLQVEEPNEARPSCDSAAIDHELHDVELKELEYRGKWLLLFDRKRKDENGLTEQDKAWFKIEELVEKGLLSYAMVSTVVGDAQLSAEKQGCIWCFTEDYRDEHDVRVRAEVIRETLLVELGDKEILYVEDTAAQPPNLSLTLAETSIYRQTSDYKFWKKGNNGEWHHVDRTKKKPVQTTSREFLPAVPSRVKTVPWIGPSVVEREKYNVRQKATRTSVIDTVEDRLGKIFVENTTTEIKLKDNSPTKVIDLKQSRLRDDTSKEGGRKETRPTVMKCEETNLGTPSIEDGPSDSKNNVNYSEIRLNNIRSIQDGLHCSAPDESKADDTGTNDRKPNQRPTNEDDDGELLEQYLELEDPYTKFVQDEASCVGISTKFFINCNLGLKSDGEEKEEGKAEDAYKEAKERQLLRNERKETDDGKGDVRSEKRENVNQETREKETEGNGGDEDDGKQQKEKNYRGMWILVFDKTERDTRLLTQLDRAWMKIDDLCEKGFLQYAQVSTAAFNRYPCSATVGCIFCYTENYKNEEDVRWTSDIIRHTLEEELGQSIIYYSKARLKKIKYYGLEDGCKYLQTPDHCLWKGKGKWTLVPRMKGIRRTRENYTDRELVPSKIAYRHSIHLYYPTTESETDGVSRFLGSAPIYIANIKKPVLHRPNKNSLKRKAHLSNPTCSASSDGLTVRASGITSDEDVRLSCSVSAVGEEVKPDGSVSEGVGVTPSKTGPEKAQTTHSSESENYGGKWMLHLDDTARDHNGITLQDRVWFKIEDLCLEKRLYRGSVSTARYTDRAHTPGVGCISCFTEDYRNVGDVRRKGYLIRKTLERELGNTAIYYKTNSATEKAQYAVLGCQRICIYKQEPDCSLWEKIDGFPYWKRIF